MDKGVFITKIEQIKPAIYGHGKDIAERAGVNYVQYHNYIKGLAPDPEIRQRIYDAICTKMNEIKNILITAG